MKRKHIWAFTALAVIITLLPSCGVSSQSKAVDLGLSVLWANENVGANCESDFGSYLAWGETWEKDHYFYDNYQFTEPGDGQSTVDIGECISGTEYDMATALWGDGWRLPTADEMKELIEKCVWEWETKSDVLGVKVTGPSGKSIFLPAGGENGDLPDEGAECSYWTGTLSRGIGRTAVSLLCHYDAETEETTLRTFGTYKVFGLLVRPVKDK